MKKYVFNKGYKNYKKSILQTKIPKNLIKLNDQFI